MKIDILGVMFDAVSRKEALAILEGYLEGDKVRMLFTPNPEIVMDAQKDKELLRILNKGDLVVPDGIGIVWASKFTKKRIKERVAGYDLLQALFNSIKDKEYTVYFFGGGKGVAEAAKVKMEQKYKNLKIVGVSDGYFDDDKESLIIENIKKLRPDILLVGLGSPKQEKWIYKQKSNLPVKLMAGVGGSFDGFAGTLKRAPDIFIKLNLEWLHRLIKQPKRIRRQLNLPMFAASVVIKYILRRQHEI